MNIADQINKEQLEVITIKNYEPKYVYLGKVEFEQFISWAVDEYDLPERPELLDGLEFLGLKIFEVKAMNHLNVV